VMCESPPNSARMLTMALQELAEQEERDAEKDLLESSALQRILRHGASPAGVRGMGWEGAESPPVEPPLGRRNRLRFDQSLPRSRQREGGCDGAEGSDSYLGGFAASSSDFALAIGSTEEGEKEGEGEGERVKGKGLVPPGASPSRLVANPSESSGDCLIPTLPTPAVEARILRVTTIERREVGRPKVRRLEAVQTTPALDMSPHVQ
ncbi:hypothetical protein KIPB_014406, partial [Kipferlia bialata]